MAKWPNGARARLPLDELTAYCRHPEQPRGKDQARVCATVLGITCDRANARAALVRQAAMEGDITKEGMTVFGRYYHVDWAIPLRGKAA
jgi:hypothetical protein